MSNTNMNDVFIVDAVRSPVGKIGGAFSNVRPDDLGAHALKSLMDRMQSVDPTQIEEVYFGAANGAGEDNRNVARMSVLLAGLPTSSLVQQSIGFVVRDWKQYLALLAQLRLVISM